MPKPSRAFLLGSLLKSVSRSFYLTLRVLPTGMRDPVGLAYLLARAADTIADTSLIPPEKRMELLLSLRSQVNNFPDEEALPCTSWKWTVYWNRCEGSAEVGWNATARRQRH